MNHNQIYRFWRSAAQCLLGGIAVALVTFVCFRLNVSITTAALLYLIVVVLASLTGSFVLSAVVSIIAILCLDYVFTEPRFTIDLTLREPLNLVALITFLGTALVITSLMAKVRKSFEVLREQAGLLDLTHDTIFVRNMSDIITYWNRGAEELYGWTREQAVGKVTHQLLQTIFPTPLEQINEELLRTDRWAGELVHTKRDGTKVTVASRWSLQRDDHGRPAAILETNNDITERKQAEEERRYNTRLLRTITDNASSMLFMVDAAGRGTFANPAMERTTGYQAQELIGQVVHDKIHHTYPDGRPYPPSECSLAEAVRMRKAVRGEDFFVRKDGTFFPVRYSASPVFRDNVTVGTVIEVQDLTESKAAEEEVRKQAELLSLAHDAIIVRDPESRIIFWNQGAENTYGWTAEEAIGRVTHELLQTRFPLSREAVDVALRERGEWEGELTHITRKGAAIAVTSRQSLRRVERGAAAAILEINRDVTERKQAEEALRAAQAELAHVARVMTMGELAASIAHEVNQPLSGMVLNANASLRWLAGATPNLDEAREALSRIIRDGNRASDVIAKIRALLRKTDMEKERLDMNDAIREVVALAQGEVRRTGVALRAELEGDLPRVLGDRVQLQQVILNLVMNSIEAMSAVTDRSRDLLIRSHQHESDKVLVAVQDSGMGLDPKNMERIFHAFYTTKSEGLGMGLAISRSIVENHGGRLWAAPNDGPGATFQFTLVKHP
jgi:two-component system, LuxR family, sensor kinase FixL